MDVREIVNVGRELVEECEALEGEEKEEGKEEEDAVIFEAMLPDKPF